MPRCCACLLHTCAGYAPLSAYGVGPQLAAGVARSLGRLINACHTLYGATTRLTTTIK